MRIDRRSFEASMSQGLLVSGDAPDADSNYRACRWLLAIATLRETKGGNPHRAPSKFLSSES